ncbi:MAG: hypothetical protein IT353_04925 [Gemmatimonadaceae bacterium]|nr:hypothetical protein [Gemmatimonadaceae bacterium]
MIQLRTIAIAALSLTALVACGKKDQPAPAAETTAVAPPPAPEPKSIVATLDLGRHIGDNKRVTDTTSVFAPKDTFYLAVVSENTAPGAMATAKWTFQTGQTVDSTTQAIATPDAASPVSVTEFHIVKPSGWPVGKYKVELMIDGASRGSRDFEVKK